MGNPKLTLLGQRSLKCPSCSQVTLYPMSKAYLAIYLFLLLTGLFRCSQTLATNHDLQEQYEQGSAWPVLGGLGIVTLLALTKDLLLRIRRWLPDPEPVIERLVWLVVVLACLASVAFTVIVLSSNGWRFVG